jgi:hypothetical protein
MAQIKASLKGNDQMQARIISGDSIGARLTTPYDYDAENAFQSAAQKLSDTMDEGRMAYVGSGIAGGNYFEIFETEDNES